ncbi:MAG: FAD:protein FMN transferase [Pseudomonadota bacterium]|nr:FAD:protein FMN transferase [Pseudomonadota bacterium]
MATRWSVLCDADPQLDQAALHTALAAAVARVDQQMSPFKPDSDLMRLNRAAPGEWVSLPPEIMTVLARALEIARLSDGAFDPAVGALVNAWGFGAEREDPDAAAIRVAAQWGGPPAHQSLELDLATGRARKHADALFDLCGIAKGYGVDQMTAVLQAHGVAHALVALDGELRALGTQANGEPWAVAVESPEPGRRAARGVIELADVAVATSGDYRRWVQIGEARLSHTMDSRRAAPVNNGVASVTVLASDCMSADAWATALLVSGPVQGLALAQRMGLEALFMLRREGRWVEMGLGRFATAGVSVGAGLPAISLGSRPSAAIAAKAAPTGGI